MATKRKQTGKPNDEYADFGAKRAHAMKITVWVAVGALLLTTAISMGIAAM